MIDLPGLKFDLGEDIKMPRSTVCSRVQGELTPRAGETDRTDQFPMDAWRKMGELGVSGIIVAEEYGGANIGYLAHMIAMEGISRASASMGLLYGAHSSLCANQIHRNGTAAQKARHLPKLVSGEWAGVLAMNESNAGSDIVSTKLRAELKGDHHVLSGIKIWIISSPDCGVLAVYTKTEPELGARGMTAFIVKKGMKGFSVAQELDKLGTCGSHMGELVFENVEAPVENILGRENGDTKVLMSGLDHERAMLSGSLIGIMQACMDVVTPYIYDHKQFGQGIGEFQLIQGKMTDMHTTLQAYRAYLHTVGKNLDSLDRDYVRQVRKDCAGVILYTAEKATWVIGEVIQILGGNSYINGSPVGRLWHDAKLYEIGTSTSEIHCVLIGHELYAKTM